MMLDLFIFSLIGAFLYRLRGAPWLDFLVRPIKQVLYVSGLWIAADASAGHPFIVLEALANPFWDGTLYLADIAGVLSVGAVCLGHGAYMNLAHNETFEHLDERPVGWILRPLAPWLGIAPGSFAYDAIGLTLNGILMTLPFSILFWATGHTIAGFIALAAGASKTLAYLIGRRTPLRRFGATEVGEYLTGAFQWGLFGIIFIMLTA